MRLLRRSLVGGWVIVLVLMATDGSCAAAQSPDPPAVAMSAHPELNLEVHTRDGRTVFHMGEIIPLELVFSSTKHDKVLIGEDCGDSGTYSFHATPAGFLDRRPERDAAGFVDGWNCHGWRGEKIDLAAKPMRVDMLLNNKFRMQTSGHYKVSVTTRRIGFLITSNALEIEILPRDPAWEQQELAKANALTSKDIQSRWEGCNILSYLETRDAELQMARDYATLDSCSQPLYGALVNVRNRKDVVDEMEAGIVRAETPVRQYYLHTLAMISLFQQHPDWYPTPLPGGVTPDPGDPYRALNKIWPVPGVVSREELRYVDMLAGAIAQKSGEGRAVSLKTLLELDRSFMGTAVPAKFALLAREQLPAVFLKLSGADRQEVLEKDWTGVGTPQAMVPVLTEIVKHDPEGPRGLALRCLIQLSPADARPVVMDVIRSDIQYNVSDLSGLPDKDLPEMDSMLLDRLKREFPDDYWFDTHSAYVSRYASAAIAGEVQGLVAEKLFTLNWHAQSYLVGYFLRVKPPLGRDLLRKEMALGGRNDFDVSALADVTAPHDTETAALMALDSTDPKMVHDALYLLQQFGTLANRPIVLNHFRAWSAHWKSRREALDQQGNAFSAAQESRYVDALAAPFLWLAAPGDIEVLQHLCVTQGCKDQVAQLADRAKETQLDIAYLGPGFGPVPGDAFSVGQYQAIVGLEQLKRKLAQYPKGIVLTVTSTSGGYRRTQEIYEALLPFAAEHGFELHLEQRKQLAEVAISKP